MKKNRIVTSVLIGGLLMGGSFAAAAPASARVITSYCQSQLNITQTGNTAGLACQMQAGPASVGGYTYDIDGDMQTNSWKGMQKWLHDAGYGYYGPQDGVPGTNTYKAMQRFAAQYGYTGPIDGDMQTASYLYFGKGIHVAFFSD
jgi:hypothetical protein